DPVETARHWEKQGTKLLHLVDLDGAFAGHSVHTEIIASIVRAISIPVELGGGIRSLDTIQRALHLGVTRVILGSVAVTQPEIVEKALQEFSSEKIALGVDALGGKIATHGWEKVSSMELFAFLRQWEEKGIGHVIYTDISRDGMLSGPDTETVFRMAEAFSFQIVVSGGIATEADVLQFCRPELPTIEGVILGKSLYAGTLDFVHLNQQLEQRRC
ncbi:MAG: 1-(5-phosphoribosyl)-5-((5-phosphoribosylamino)methylideneamino)imidazole-4-carboxamide isomerase, partial [Calditrichaeota bacterium]|nr:1-(5-phosphoribosyl)-5-((5-phosphoribosylamino)methylideneamino)imidazole-4-carboxamide isomerase [Calditrichota bacterium]